MAEALQVHLDEMRSKGLRLTRARRAVIDALVDGHGEHLSAIDIAGRLGTAHSDGEPPIDQSTVYRTLETLERAGIVTHTHMGHGALVYHLADEPPHQHLLCVDCGKTLGVPEDELIRLFDEITARTGFVADPTHVAISGRCADCMGDRRASRQGPSRGGPTTRPAATTS
ncbi:MAG TPA: Fur family transcriptional regulator [Acidimicrobiia bacterium]|jgi:Fur family ferric uptake transcriptional regulator